MIILQQVFKVVRCKSRETPDSCVEMAAMKIKDGCKFFSATNQIWSPVFRNIQPSFACPLKKVSGIFESSFVLLIDF